MHKNDFALIVSTSWSQLMMLVCYDKLQLFLEGRTPHDP